jgi:hypothetical protein
MTAELATASALETAALTPVAHTGNSLPVAVQNMEPMSGA